MEIEITNHHPEFEPSLDLLRQKLAGVCEEVLGWKEAEGSALSALSILDCSMITDARIAQVHIDFMQVPGETDVITFDHGEVLVSLDTAAREAKERGYGWEREAFLYLVHGVLHLAGFDDIEEEDRARMHKVQERLWIEFWPDSV